MSTTNWNKPGVVIDWDQTAVDYSGTFRANGQLKTGVLSWADVEPRSDLMNEPVEKIDLARALELAKIIDEDVDGILASTSKDKITTPVTSILKEGEEKFTFGASYAGTQGVNITEVSGVSAAYVHGKRVSWLDGDAWAFHKGGWAISSVDVQESRSTTKVGKKQLTTVKVEGDSISNTDADSLTRTSTAKKIIATLNLAGANISTCNVTAMEAGLAVSGISARLNVAGVNFTVGVYGHVATVAASLNTTAVTMARSNIYNCNIAPMRTSHDKTYSSLLVYDNEFVSSARNTATVALANLHASEDHLNLTTRTVIAGEAHRVSTTKKAMRKVATEVSNKRKSINKVGIEKSTCDNNLQTHGTSINNREHVVDAGTAFLSQIDTTIFQ